MASNPYKHPPMMSYMNPMMQQGMNPMMMNFNGGRPMMGQPPMGGNRSGSSQGYGYPKPSYPGHPNHPDYKEDPPVGPPSDLQNPPPGWSPMPPQSPKPTYPNPQRPQLLPDAFPPGIPTIWPFPWDAPTDGPGWGPNNNPNVVPPTVIPDLENPPSSLPSFPLEIFPALRGLDKFSERLKNPFGLW
tara:strand:+ start:137 stop:697 length:561 start_codon:yes stop_codon:yes gene_type:complete